MSLDLKSYLLLKQLSGKLGLAHFTIKGFRMNQRTVMLLEFLSDSNWHFEPPKGVGVNTVNTCHEKGFVRTKRVILKHEGDLETFRIAIHITAKGKNELKKVTS